MARRFWHVLGRQVREWRDMVWCGETGQGGRGLTASGVFWSVPVRLGRVCYGGFGMVRSVRATRVWVRRFRRGMLRYLCFGQVGCVRVGSVKAVSAQFSSGSVS